METKLNDIDVDAGLFQRKNLQVAGKIAISWILPISTILLMIFFAIQSPVFLTPGNLLSILAQNSPTFIVAAVFALLLMSGNVDLSVGSTMALAGVSAGLVLQSWGLLPGLAVGLGVGTVVGMVNGFLVGYLYFSPIVVTLGGLAAWRGLAQYLGQGSVYGFPDAFIDFGLGRVAGIPNLALFATAFCLLIMICAAWLPIGRWAVAIGVNARAAYLVGIRVRSVVFWLYTATGFAVGLAALLLIARLDSAPSGSLGVGFEVTILTAVMLGGIPFTGGRGSIWRVMVGVWLMSALRNGLTLLNIGTELSGIITGVVLVVAAALEATRIYLKRNA